MLQLFKELQLEPYVTGPRTYLKLRQIIPAIVSCVNTPNVPSLGKFKQISVNCENRVVYHWYKPKWEALVEELWTPGSLGTGGTVARTLGVQANCPTRVRFLGSGIGLAEMRVMQGSLPPSNAGIRTTWDSSSRLQTQL